MNYEKLGFKCGLEIHAQLDTSKLFCSCPSMLRKEDSDFRVERKLRAVIGETGKKDVATKLEEVKDKTFVYEGYDDTTCLVEMDSEPPHMMCKEALMVSVQVARLLNMNVLKKVLVMRKTVVDGSNTSGFQRTALIAEDGFVDTSFGRVRVDMLSLEEDAARKIKEEKDKIFYRIDRLGIPLIELRTEPDIKNPFHAVETAKKLGTTLWMTSHVKRGLGSIRQDVNVSIKGGTRVEIKGVQDLKLMPKIIENEVLRQKNIILISKELRKKSGPKRLKKDFKNVSKIFEKSKSFLKGKNVLGVCLKGFKGFISREILPNRRIGTEIADIAKMVGLKGILHSDELPAYKVSAREVGGVNKALFCGKSDAFIIVAGEIGKCYQTLELGVDRLKQFFKGVPKDVRAARLDGTTAFLRPMPGSARMYPETDLPIVEISDELLRVERVETPEQKFDKFVNMGLGEELANQVINSRKLKDFEQLLVTYKKIKPTELAKMFFGAKTELKKKGITKLTIKNFSELFGLINKGVLSKDSYVEALTMLSKGRSRKSVEKKFGVMSEDELEKLVKKVLKKNGSASFGALMGLVRGEAKGRADGKMVFKMIQQLKK